VSAVLDEFPHAGTGLEEKVLNVHFVPLVAREGNVKFEQPGLLQLRELFFVQKVLGLLSTSVIQNCRSHGFS
jgi:hypothetical protein